MFLSFRLLLGRVAPYLQLITTNGLISLVFVISFCAFGIDAEEWYHMILWFMIHAS